MQPIGTKQKNHATPPKIFSGHFEFVTVYLGLVYDVMVECQCFLKYKGHQLYNYTGPKKVGIHIFFFFTSLKIVFSCIFMDMLFFGFMISLVIKKSNHHNFVLYCTYLFNQYEDSYKKKSLTKSFVFATYCRTCQNFKILLSLKNYGLI